MRYNSSRDTSLSLSFESVLFSGYAFDGGLYVPETIPVLSSEQIEKWSNLDYRNLMKKICRLFISDNEIPTLDLNELIEKAFSGFTVADIIPIQRLSNNLIIAELFHGDTYAFKDLALNVVAQLMNYFLAKNHRHVTVLVGTSGDTGSAAICSIRKTKWIDIIVLYPKNLCTPIQELQMTTVLDANVHCYAVEGTSDDLDVPIKECLVDAKFASEFNLCCINSINWGRIMAQITHYFYIYFQVCKNIGNNVEMIVPTGGAGNITAGCISKLMGLPITVSACVNANNSVEIFWKNGEYAVSEQLHHTVSPAMDIQVAYNVERLLYFASQNNAALVKKFFAVYEQGKKSTLPVEIKLQLQSLLSSVTSFSDEEIKAAIYRCWKENSYQICPHTATAAAYHYSQLDTKGASSIRVCLATASPEKFPEVFKDLHIEPNKNVLLEKLTNLPKRNLELKRGEDWTTLLRCKIREISQKTFSL